MKIYLIRHAHAVDATPRRGDADRYLSRAGRRAAADVAAVLAREEVVLDAMVSSPLPRALQTAEIVAAGLGYDGEIEVVPGLAPGCPPRAVAEELPSRGTAVAVVGHEPTLAALGALLVSRPSFPPLRKAQVVLIERGEVRWSLDPETLRLEAMRIA